MAPRNFKAGAAPAPQVIEGGIASRALALGGIALPIKKKVTYPTLSQNTDGAIVAFTVVSPMTVSKKSIKNPEGNSNKATLVIVTDLTDGIEKQYVVPSILASEWLESYCIKPEIPDDETPKFAAVLATVTDHNYVGLSFAIQKLPKREGKRYRDLNIAEIDGEEFVRRVQNLKAEEASAV